MEVTRAEWLMGKAQARGVRPQNLRPMMRLGLVMPQGCGTDCVSLSVTLFLLIHRIQIRSHMSLCALWQHSMEPRYAMCGATCAHVCVCVCALHLRVPVHGTHDSLTMVSKSTHTCTLTHFAARSMFLRLCSSPGSACCRHRYSAAALAGNSVSQT